MSVPDDESQRPLDTVTGPIDCRVRVPGSKSISNRALVCAALASGESAIRNLAPGDDTSRMLDCLRSLGVQLTFDSSVARVRGLNGEIRGGATLDAGLAGTTSRFLTAVAALGISSTRITGSAPLKRRPMAELHDALRHLGAKVESLEVANSLPILVERADLKGGVVEIRGDVSSQFLSALMLIGPFLDGGLELRMTSPLVSRPYVMMTARVMAQFGLSGVEVEDDHLLVPEGRYEGCKYSIEPDASSASYPLAAAAIVGGRVEIEGLTRESMQGDIRILDILEEMGCTVIVDGDSCAVTRENDLVGVDIDMSDVSDLVPTVAAVALFCSTPTRIRNIDFIRHKESDRIGDLIDGIRTIGGRANEHPDGIEVFPMAKLDDEPVMPSTCHDHRLAMAWSLIALKRPGVSIDQPEVVNKSWPDWWKVRETVRSSQFH